MYGSTLRYSFLRYITLHYVTLRYSFLRYITLHYVTVSYVTLRYITLHYVTVSYVTLRYITLHYVRVENRHKCWQITGDGGQHWTVDDISIQYIGTIHTEILASLQDSNNIMAQVAEAFDWPDQKVFLPCKRWDSFQQCRMHQLSLSQKLVHRAQRCLVLLSSTYRWLWIHNEIYSVSQKKVASLKLFAMFSLVVNMCN